MVGVRIQAGSALSTVHRPQRMTYPPRLLSARERTDVGGHRMITLVRLTP